MLKNTEKSRHYGELSLTQKDAQAPKVDFPLPAERPKPIRYDQPKRNVISFSLFGDNPRYLNGAVRNATLAPDIYPGWSCRFYCAQDVPQSTLAELRSLGADVKMRKSIKPFDGLFWRFFVANDPGVDRFLVRDCDAVINTQERAAVDEWLESGKYFHLMRDYFCHTEVVLAGMWGGVGNVLPSMTDLFDQFKITKLVTNAIDQWFLREQVWPIIRQNCLIHDSVFRVFNARDFPPYARRGLGQHVGQNEAALAKSTKTSTATGTIQTSVAGGPPTAEKKRVIRLKPKIGPDQVLTGNKAKAAKPKGG